jgi:conjugal transfer pilus assembly protein TraE
MLRSNFIRKVRETLQVHVFLLISNIVLVFIVLTLANKVVLHRERIVLTPVTVNEKMSIGWSDASDNYYKAIGLNVANLVGNLTPATVDFVVTALAPMLEPSIYPPVKEKLLALSKNEVFRQANVVTFFSPSSLVFERETSKVFVTGVLTITGSTNKVNAQEITHEIGIRINEGIPQVFHLSSYPGKEARTQSWLQANPPGSPKNPTK